MADEFTGTLISMEVSAAMGKRVQNWVESYTPDDVAEGLIKTLSEQGQRPLLNAVTDLRVGTIKLGTSNGYPISVARQRVQPDGSRTVVLVTSRPFVGFAPAAGTRIDDYPFGLIELRLAADGTGEGTIVGAAQLAFDPATKDLSAARDTIQRGIETLLPHANEHGVRLGIEPLHPMMISERSAIVTLGEALDMAERIGSGDVGVIVDAYHVWWDPRLYDEITRAGRRIFGYHVADWLVPTTDLLAGRGLMGDGIIDLPRIRGRVEAAGYTGPVEVEVINPALASVPPDELLADIAARFART